MIRLDRRVDRLHELHPEMSAERLLTKRQWSLLVLLAVAIATGLVFKLALTLTLLLALATLVYLLNLSWRLYLLRVALKQPTLVAISDPEALAIPDADLPIYTVLVPAYHEGAVIGRTLRALEALNYPADRLDIKLVLEADDLETLTAARSARPSLEVETIRVPAGMPRTKPKACNYALGAARGALITIFDAEDVPDPLQLRRAVAAFWRVGPQVACLQAKLSYHNATQNLITRWFTAEYDAWFALMLPALAEKGGPVPLGGTSMHIRREVLDEVGGWDSYNVTEDADLGVRLQRLGYRVMVLDSTTLEEANSDFVNWVKQRSRWYKGYLQTWLVHMRQPVRLWRELGARGFMALSTMVGAVPIAAIISPLFWALTALWFLDRNPFLASLLPPVVYYPALLSLVIGNFVALYIGLIAIRATNRPSLIAAALLVPAYWLMMSIAAIRALFQLLIAPSFWDKSVHGLDNPRHTEQTEHALG